MFRKVSAYRKRYKVFDDPLSFIHALASALSVIFNVSFEATICYLLYQYLDVEFREEKLGDIVEWIVGLIVGGFAKFILLA